MKKTYVTTMPNHIGSFLKASECFASLGINITRVSYNKAIDSHTLFIDVEGESDKLEEAEKYLKDIGYLQSKKNENRIVLLEFHLKDVPGSVTDVLELINQFNFNISYLSSQENETDHQFFKMGLFVDNEERLNRFISDVKVLCDVKILDYNYSEKVYDNSIFYDSFISGLTQTIGLDDDVKYDLLVNANLAMQMLDERGLSPHKAFDSISRFAYLLSACRGNNFNPRITHHKITEETEIIIIEPDCGSNTTIIISRGEVLFIDCGYALYKDEMLKLLSELLDGFSTLRKRILITHADLDHCGLLPCFDEILTTKKSAECLISEYNGKDGYREELLIHKPYIKMCKILTSYRPVSPDKLTVLWDRGESTADPLANVGTFDFGELHFEVFEGKGGHLPGETVLIDRKHGIVFTGDIYINIRGLTPAQAEYNQYAPILMSSVDTDPELCALERMSLMRLLGKGTFKIFGAHGSVKELEI